MHWTEGRVRMNIILSFISDAFILVNHKVYSAAPISVSLALRDNTVLHCQSIDMGPMHHEVFLFASQLLLCSLCLTLEGWSGWFDLGY